MKAGHYFIFCFIFLSFSVFAQQEATTPDGRKILIYPDGTWKPAAPAESSTDLHPVSIAHLELPRTNPKDQIITHQAYTLSFNKTYHIANWVAYELTADKTVAVVKRSNKFVSDLLLTSYSISNADYKGSGYDKGHLAPSADMCFHSGAKIDFNKVITINPTNAKAYYYRAGCNYNLGLKESACKDWSKAGELGYEQAYKDIREYCNF